MTKKSAAAMLLLCALCIFPAAGRAEDFSPPPPSDARTVEGLKNWFEGNDAEAEKIFSELTAENTEDPVPYHALAMLLSDRRTDYPRITELYNRHRVLAPDNQEAYKAILPLLDEYAAAGCLQAQLMRAHTFGWGLGGSPNYVRLLLLLRRASDGGYAAAQQELGLVYESGKIVERNIREAVRLYSAAAAQNDAFAMRYLAVLYINNKDSTESEKQEAVRLLRRASDAEFPEAQSILAQMYREGIEVEKDPDEAFRLYEKAARNGSTDAMLILAVSYDQGVGVERSPREAVKWYRAAADRADVGALFRLGVLYYTGRYVEEDHAEAFNYFKRAAERGDITSWYNVAWLYLTGDGTDKDPVEARKWFERSAMTGNSEAQRNLGVIYISGDGVEVSPEEACFWFELARLSGDEDSQEYIERIAKELDPAAADRARRRAQTAFRKISLARPQEDE